MLNITEGDQYVNICWNFSYGHRYCNTDCGEHLMSNQRPGKTHRAAASDSMTEMKLRNFFRTAAELLRDEPDAQFYFQQIVDHINQGGSIMTDDPKTVSRILGV